VINITVFIVNPTRFSQIERKRNEPRVEKYGDKTIQAYIPQVKNRTFLDLIAGKQLF